LLSFSPDENGSVLIYHHCKKASITHSSLYAAIVWIFVPTKAKHYLAHTCQSPPPASRAVPPVSRRCNWATCCRSPPRNTTVLWKENPQGFIPSRKKEKNKTTLS